MQPRVRYVGVDLAGPTRLSGLALLDEAGALIDIGTAGDDAALLARIDGVPVVAIDAPLGLPEGLCCLDATCGCMPVRTPGIRLCEIAVRERGYGLYHTTKRTIIPQLVMRGIALRRTLESRGARVLEAYPYAAKAALFGRPMPKKQTPGGRAWLRAQLAPLVPGVDAVERDLTHDELDAIVAAYAAVLLDRGEAEELGDPREGTIVVPVARAPAAVTA